MAASERGKSRKVLIQLSDSLSRRLDQAARESGVTKSAFIRVDLERELTLDQQLAREIQSKTHPRKQEERGDRQQLRLFSP